MFTVAPSRELKLGWVLLGTHYSFLSAGCRVCLKTSLDQVFLPGPHTQEILLHTTYLVAINIQFLSHKESA